LGDRTGRKLRDAGEGGNEKAGQFCFHLSCIL
jgi:hypothetical protein